MTGVEWVGAMRAYRIRSMCAIETIGLLLGRAPLTNGPMYSGRIMMETER